MSDRRPIRFGLIGCGAISTQHLEAIAAVDGASIAAVASHSAERARATGERWSVPWTTDVDELLARDDVDAVAITTPSGLHPAQALAALARGKHALVEKPIALSVADADAVIEEAEKRGLTVATVSQRRFEPAVRTIHEAVSAGALGRLSLIVAEGLYHRPQAYYDSGPWRGTIALDGGVLMNQAIHLIDLLRWVGGPVETVSAHVATLGHRMEAEDTATVSLRFTSGTLGEIVATTCATPEFPTELRIYGDSGHIRLVGEDAAEWDVPKWAAPAARESDPAESDPAERAQATSATWGTNAKGYVRQYTDFIGAISERRAPFVTAMDGREAVAIVTAAYEASRTGCAITLREGPQ
jgi:predicted dehydrogenase